MTKLPTKPSGQLQRPAAGNTAQMQVTTLHATRSGPLPTPAELAQYGEVDASYPERIVRMAELEQQKRHDQTDRALAVSETIALRGQAFGFTIAALALVATCTLAYLDSHAAAGIVGGLDIAALAAVFVLGRRPVRPAKPTAPPEAKASE